MADMINSPPHYNQGNMLCPNCSHPIECIDVTRHLNFNLGNVIKYVWRHEHKNGLEDLEKALWYLKDEIARRITVGV